MQFSEVLTADDQILLTESWKTFCWAPGKIISNAKSCKVKRLSQHKRPFSVEIRRPVVLIYVHVAEKLNIQSQSNQSIAQ